MLRIGVIDPSMVIILRRMCCIPVSWLALCWLTTLALGAMSHAARATEEASSWSKAVQSSIRLISGGVAQSGALRAGVEIRLSPGYKTYWRSPGDSGIPPRFDWSGSENLAGIQVKWPAPTRFSDGTGFSVGYIKDVIFPLSITAIDAAKPVILRLSLDYAVCDKLCIPAQGTAEITLQADQKRLVPRLDQRLASAEAQVPLRAAIGVHPERPALLEAGAVISNGKTILHLALS